MSKKLSVRCESFKPFRSNSLFGFVDIVVPEIHLRIREATIHQSHGKRWIGLPARPQLTKEGTARRDDRGKVQYVSILEFLDRPTRDAFSARAVAAVLETFPEAFGGA